jgi:hypothetical protein
MLLNALFELEKYCVEDAAKSAALPIFPVT